MVNRSTTSSRAPDGSVSFTPLAQLGTQIIDGGVAAFGDGRHLGFHIESRSFDGAHSGTGDAGPDRCRTDCSRYAAPEAAYRQTDVALNPKGIGRASASGRLKLGVCVASRSCRCPCSCGGCTRLYERRRADFLQTLRGLSPRRRSCAFSADHVRGREETRPPDRRCYALAADAALEARSGL